MSFLIIVAAMIVFSAGTNMPAYAQMSKAAGSDSMEEPLITAGDSKDVQAKETVPPVEEPVMKIERLDNEGQVYSFELKDAQIRDIFRVLAYDHKLNLLVDNEVEGKITATMTNVSLEQFLEAAAEALNLTIEKNGSFIKVKPNLITKVFILKHVEARTVLLSPESVETGKSESVETGKSESVETGKSESVETGKSENTIYDLLSAKGKIFLGRQPNSIMVIDYPPNIKKLEDYLQEIDRRMSSRIFKLKYLKASDIAGIENSTQAEGASSASESSEDSSSMVSPVATGG